MISIPNVEVKEASRVYGDMVEKVAFNVAIDPASVLGAMAGGYVANRIQNKAMAERAEADQERLRQQHTIENGYYSQVSNVLANLKIVFTPINVIYSVGGQVFEILSVNEMTPDMKRAFLQQDAGYFRDLLVNKMNMELQLAEQAFSRMLLSNQGVNQASFQEQQAALLDIDEDTFGLLKTAAEQTDIILHIPVNFDALRPFDHSQLFFNPREFSKVAGIFDYFSHKDDDVLTMDDLEKQVNVGFLPDRVVFLHNGQLLEQLPVLFMNQEGYDAFRRQDKQFFLNFFKHKAHDIAAGVAKDVADDAAGHIGKEGEVAEESEEHIAASEPEEQTAASLEEVVTHLGSLRTFSPLERAHINFFRDADIHPLLYDKILSDKYGDDWATHELEALLKQVEIDFHLDKGLGQSAIDKIGMIYAAKSEDSSVFLTPLTFEKFMRAMNNKDVDFSDFQGNLEFEEVLFGFDIAKALRGDDVYDESHTTVSQYVSEEFFNDTMRFVSDQVYDENNVSERAFYDMVNGYLARKWKSFDAHGLTGDAAALHHRITDLIVSIGDTVLQEFVDRISMSDVYGSVAKLIDSEGFLKPIQEEFREFVRNALIRNVSRHVSAALYLELKRQELVLLNSRWEEMNSHGQ